MKAGSQGNCEGDLSDKFELESEGLQEKVTFPVMKVACHDHTSLVLQESDHPGQKETYCIPLMKAGSHRNCEGDLSDKFELESEGLHKEVTYCIPVMKVACHDQRSLLHRQM